MADFKPKKLDLTQINGGKEYEDRQGIQPIAINAPIEASAWVQMLAKTQPDFSEANNVGTPSVSIEYDANGYPYFKFANLKGETGTAEGESFLTKTEADETYLPKPKDEYSSYRAVVMKLYQKNRDTGETDTLTVLMNGTFGFKYEQATGGANLAIAKAGETEIKEQWGGTRPICTDKLSLAVKVGVTKNTDTLTDEEKASAQTWLGVKKYYKHHLNFYKEGFSSFTLEFISSEATAYTNGGTAINEGLVGQNAKTIFLYNVYDPTGDNSGQAGFVVGSVAGYSNSDTDNGVYLSGAWSTNAGGAVKSIFDKIAIPFTSDTVTEI